MEKIIYQTLCQEEALQEKLAAFGNKPAVFFQNAPSDLLSDWGEEQFPRIDYLIDKDNSPFGISRGILKVNIWCLDDGGILPEDIAPLVIQQLHGLIVKAGREISYLSWQKDYLHKDISGKSLFSSNRAGREPTGLGMTLTFSLQAIWLDQEETMLVTAANDWVKGHCKNLLVTGRDNIAGALRLEPGQGLISWQQMPISAMKKQSYGYSWIEGELVGYLATNAGEGAAIGERLLADLSLSGEIVLKDGTPGLLQQIHLKPGREWCQITAAFRYGVIPQKEAGPAYGMLDHIILNEDEVNKE